MNLSERIGQDLKEAMKSKDQAALRTLRAIKSAILLEMTSGGDKGVDEETGMKLLVKQAKQRRDSIAQFVANGREDLAKTEQEELEVIERYLPKALSKEEIEAQIKTIIAETGSSSIKDMGKVMGVASKKMAGKADGKVISEVVRALLNS